MTRSKKSEFNFEKALTDLSSLVEKMEHSELTLEQSLNSFEQGIKLTRECHQALQAAEQKVQILIEQNAESELTDFDIEQEDNG